MSVNFYFYRLPGQSEVIGYRSETYGEGFSPKAFIIAPFDLALHPVINIPGNLRIDQELLGSLAEKALKEQASSTLQTGKNDLSTSREEHSSMILSIKQEIEHGNLKKCVISRTIGYSGEIDVEATFHNLCHAYPNAFVFCYYCGATGLWMGASPELLLECKDNEFSTVALAGTKETGASSEWDVKNKEEQRLVRDYIIDTFRKSGILTQESKTESFVAGPVSHLITRITGTPADSRFDGFDLALNLSPTPALSGHPKDRSIKKIKAIERHDREYYGGFAGPAESNKDFRFYVNLRSMKIYPHGYVLYSGGGIMKDSDIDEEWEETEKKSRTLIEHITLKKS